MNVKVLSIKPAQKPNSHEVLLSIGENKHLFKFTTEVNQVGGRQLQTTHGERRFLDWFRFNQRVAMNISKLVSQFSNKEAVKLPADVGKFVTPEEAVSTLKPFKYDRQPETGDGGRESLIAQDTGKMSQDARQKAIALVENLPDSLLDEAVQVLESLSVKTNTPE